MILLTWRWKEQVISQWEEQTMQKIYTPIGSRESRTGEATSKWAGADSNTLRDGLVNKSVILPGFICKTKETEEDEGTKNGAPANKLQEHCRISVTMPFQAGNQSDGREIFMNILPANPWVKGRLGWNRNVEEGEWYIENDFSTSKAHESNESVRASVAVAWDQGAELGAIFIEGNDSHDRVGGREKPNNNWGQKNDGVYGPNVIRSRIAANIFENVESMTLNDVVCKLHVRKCE